MSSGAHKYVMGNYNKTAGSSGLTVSTVPAEHIDIYSGTGVNASHLEDTTGENSMVVIVQAFSYSAIITIPVLTQVITFVQSSL